ncbi:hypothetical protein N7G274_005350 [Stereocaulon virgatum]|uniref:DUF6594 domain-containing protein n=1 Tax=Stereocaulon virgatum TaxID=373712 RepID=A0ABR4A8D9_9LECA
MAGEDHRHIKLGDEETFASSSGQAQPPQEPTSAILPTLSGAATASLTQPPHRPDSESSSLENHERKSFLTRLQRAIGLPIPEITFSYRVPPIIRPLSEFESGYSRLAAFEDCDPNFLIYRKFGWLHNRVLLYHQDELQKLEQELEQLDKWDSTNGHQKALESHRKDFARRESKRKPLITAIHNKLNKFDELLFQLQKLQAMKQPSKRSQNSLYQMSIQNIVEKETAWVCQREDLIALAQGAEHGWFNAFLEDFLNIISRKALLAIFRSRDQKIKTGSLPELNLVSPERFDALLRALLTVLAAAQLLIPVVILFELQPNNQAQARQRSRYQILTIFAATLIFSASCSIFTKARKQEVFAATAAYCAVLVVFLGNASNVMTTSGKAP